MIPYIQPIFIPDQKRFEINEKSIRSFFEYLKIYPYDIKIVLGGWAKTDEFWNKIENIITSFSLDKKIILKRFDRNYGKAYIVNTLFEYIKNENFKYFLTADSDMIFDIKINNIFERLEDIPVNSERLLHKPFGVAYLNQYEHCCHLPYIYENKYTFINRYGETEVLVFGNAAHGMGGGAIFINKEPWIKINGYRVMGVYAGDDAYLMLDIDKIKYSYQMTYTIGLIHPFQHDTEYFQWKQSVVHRDTSRGIIKSTDELNKIINEADTFWENKQN